VYSTYYFLLGKKNPYIARTAISLRMETPYLSGVEDVRYTFEEGS